MADRTFLDWPFFEPRHRRLAEDLDAWATANLADVDHTDTDAACRQLVALLGEAGWLTHSAVDPEAPAPLDVRTLCLIRETLARHDGLADFAFAMQGLGTGALSLFGTPEQQARWLPETRAGNAVPGAAERAVDRRLARARVQRFDQLAGQNRYVRLRHVKKCGQGTQSVQALAA